MFDLVVPAAFDCCCRCHLCSVTIELKRFKEGSQGPLVFSKLECISQVLSPPFFIRSEQQTLLAGECLVSHSFSMSTLPSKDAVCDQFFELQLFCISEIVFQTQQQLT